MSHDPRTGRGQRIAALALALIAGCTTSSVTSPSPENPPTPAARRASALIDAGRDVYLAEGCYNCHGTPDDRTARALAQQVPPVTPGPVTRPLIGARTPGWRARLIVEPRATSPGAIMPPYPFLADAPIGQPLGSTDNEAATALAARIAVDGPTLAQDSQLVALIAFIESLQSQGH